MPIRMVVTMGVDDLVALAVIMAVPAVSTVTVSLGVAEYRPGETSDELFARADEALYRAKDGGRDRVAVAR